MLQTNCKDKSDRGRSHVIGESSLIIYKAKLWSSLSKRVVGLELESIKTDFSGVGIYGCLS